MNLLVNYVDGVYVGVFQPSDSVSPISRHALKRSKRLLKKEQGVHEVLGQGALKVWGQDAPEGLGFDDKNLLSNLKSALSASNSPYFYADDKEGVVVRCADYHLLKLFCSSYAFYFGSDLQIKKGVSYVEPSK